MLAGEDGAPVDPAVRRSAEHLLGADLADARVHQGPADREFAKLLGARAATHGRDIFLAEGESATDASILRHELAHVAEGGDQVQLRSATWLERRAWLGFFSHYLPRKFLNNYMDDNAAAIVLTLQEMQDCNPIVNIRRSPAFMAQVARLVAAGGGIEPVKVSGWGGALTNGTLGNFTIYYVGNLVVNADGTWNFIGALRFHDYWDFDPKGGGSNRPIAAEAKVRVAAAFLPGRPFTIDSVLAPSFQTDTDTANRWGLMRAPTAVGDHGVRTAVDIETGGEAGAQASEDLN